MRPAHYTKPPHSLPGLTALVRRIAPYLLAALSGALLPLALAPFHLWWMAVISLGVLAYLLRHVAPRQGALLGWAHGSGSFLVGVSWIYIAIHDFGYYSVGLSVLMTAAFCIAMGLLPGVMGYGYCRWVRDGLGGHVLGFAAVWLLVEWLRSWVLTGFPWLLAGYAMIDTPVAGWAPVIGVFGLTFWVALAGGALAGLASHWRRGLPPFIASLALAGLGLSLQQQQWTQPADKAPLTVGLVQSNISQDKKWQDAEFWATLEFYDVASQPLWGSTDLVIWPEAAVPALYHHAIPYFDYIRDLADKAGGALITGVPTRNGDDLYNSVMVISGGEGIYNKQRLVPFGEYVPLRQFMGTLISIFDLPLSSFSRGKPDQPHLDVKGWQLAGSICYEIVYPDLIARGAEGADILFTISNDGWFGDSIGPSQHMQMAQMRALENGRELIRVTSTGITGLIDHRGQITHRLPSFTQGTLVETVQARVGTTPFTRFGSAPILILAALTAALATLTRRQTSP
ncbi:apolipoprotein N-acyltransferase [Spongiibacter taiwanensis]